jgi:hypothetical protein
MPAETLAQIRVDPDRGPSPEGDFSISPNAFIALLLIGFLVGGVGHLYRSKTLVASGVLMIFLATVGIPVYLAITR